MTKVNKSLIQINRNNTWQNIKYLYMKEMNKQKRISNNDKKDFGGKKQNF